MSRRKGHVYHAGVYDIGSTPRRLIWSGEGRTKNTLRRFFDDLGPERAKQLTAVCCDMWASHVEVVAERAPAGRARVRQIPSSPACQRGGQRGAQGRGARAEGQRPRAAQGHPLPLARAPRQPHRSPTGSGCAWPLELEKRGGLKVLRAWQLTRSCSAASGATGPGRGPRSTSTGGSGGWATHSRMEPMREFAWMLRRHEDGVLGWFDHRIDNGAVEG